MDKITFEQLEDLIIYFSTSIIEKETEEEIVWDLAKTCISKLGFEDCVIYLINEDKQLYQAAAYGPKNPKAFDIHEPIIINIGEGISGTVAKTMTAEIVNDTSKDSRYIVDDLNRSSEIAVPIVAGGQILGVIDSEHSQKNYFKKQHLKILNAFASICGIRLLNVRKEKALANEQQKLLQIERELIDLRVKSLKSQMNPHFMFNALNAIQFFITSNDRKDALKYLSTFSRLLRKYIDHLGHDFTAVYDEIKILEGYIHLQQLRYGNRLDYSLRIDDELFNYKIPSLVLQLAVEDLIETNIMNNTGAAKINLDFQFAEKGMLKAEISLESARDSVLDRKVEDTYRSDKFSWQQHINVLNKLKRMGIEKEVDVDVSEAHIVTKINLLVPLNIDTVES